MPSALVHVSLPVGVETPRIQVKTVAELHDATCTWDSTVIIGCLKEKGELCLYEWGTPASDDCCAASTPAQLEGAKIGGTAFAELIYSPARTQSNAHTDTPRGYLHVTISATRKSTSILLPFKISKVSTGGLGHAILLDDVGCAWAFGNNRYFQCGLTAASASHIGPGRPSAMQGAAAGHDYIDSPTRLRMFGPQSAKGCIIEAACGWNHSALITSQFHLFTFGLNNFGQCGVESTLTHDGPVPNLVGTKRPRSAVQLDMSQSACVLEPTRVEDFDAVAAAASLCMFADQSNCGIGCMQQVSCGAWHTVALTRAGDVYTVGQGSFGQLGHDYPISDDARALTGMGKGKTVLSLGTTALFRGAESSFRQVAQLRDVVVRQVAAGPKCTFCVALSGELYGMGHGSNLTSAVSGIPVKVAFTELSESLSAFPDCVRLWVGRSHVLLFLSSTTTAHTSSANPVSV